MSLHTGVIAIRGNRLKEIVEVFERCDYRLLGEPAIYDSVDDAWNDLADEPEDRTKVKKLVYVDGGWTYIIDDELVMLIQDEVWSQFSAEWKTRIFGWICEGSSGTYAIAVFDDGEKVRDAFYCDGELRENDGPRCWKRRALIGRPRSRRRSSASPNEWGRRSVAPTTRRRNMSSCSTSRTWNCDDESRLRPKK